MPIIIPSLPATVRTANDAFNALHPSDDKRSLDVNSPNGGAQPLTLRYPHVFYNVHNPDDPRNLLPYAWQIIYGGPDDPIANEVGATTAGDADDVATVRGPRLKQTVQEMLNVIRDHEHDPESTTIQLLHIRASNFRAIILRHSTAERSTIIPLAPMPEVLMQKREWTFNEFFDALRKVWGKTEANPGI